MLIKTAQLCKVTGVTRRTLTEWVRRGLPKVSHGTFDLEESLQWWRENILDENGSTVADSKRLYWAAKAKREQMAADVESGEYIEAEKVEREAFKIGLQMRETLEAIPTRIAPLVAASSDRFECQQIMDQEIYHVLTNLSESLKTPAPKNQKEKSKNDRSKNQNEKGKKR